MSEVLQGNLNAPDAHQLLADSAGHAYWLGMDASWMKSKRRWMQALGYAPIAMRRITLKRFNWSLWPFLEPLLHSISFPLLLDQSKHQLRKLQVVVQWIQSLNARPNLWYHNPDWCKTCHRFCLFVDQGCIHCQGWICNSSICMTRRGLKPTGIAIFDAQQQGFLSVAHHVQVCLLNVWCHAESRLHLRNKILWDAAKPKLIVYDRRHNGDSVEPLKVKYQAIHVRILFCLWACYAAQAKLIQHRSRYTEETEPAESKAEAPNSEITTAIAISRSKKKGSNKPPKAAQREDGMLLAKPTAQRLTRLQHKEQNDEH